MMRTTLWLIRRQLKVKSARTRLRAVKKLRLLEEPELLELLVGALGDEESVVRGEAAEALGEMKDERAVRALMAAMDDISELVQEAAIASLGRQGNKLATDRLVSALLRGTPNVQWRAARALKGLGWQPKCDAEEIQFHVALGDLNRTVGFGVAAVNALAGVLQHDSYERRVAAVNVLGEINDPAVLKPLQGALRDPDALVRTAAAYALARVADSRIVPGLIQALNDSERNVRVAAATTLGRLGDRRAVEPLIQSLKDREWEVRAAALEALGRLGDARASEPVAAHIEDRDQEVREQAAEAMGRLGDDSCLEKLVLAMVDEHMGVRQAAGRTLSHLDPYWERSERVQLLVPHIEAALQHKDVSVRYAATLLLRRLTGRSALESELVGSPTAVVQKTDSALGILQDLLSDPDEEVRLAAAEALGRLRSSASADGLKAALGDASAWVRMAAQQAIHSLSTDAVPAAAQT